MESKSTRIVLPVFTLTQVCNADTPGATKVSLPDGTHYYIRPKLLPDESFRPDGKPRWAPREFETYPIIMKGDGSPWDEANAWILSILEEKYDFEMSTYRNKADDIQHFRNFIDSRNFDWMEFPEFKQLRPTYRYRGFLRVELDTGGMAWSTASRRMASVVHFYRWLIQSETFVPDQAPWLEDDVYIPVENDYGRTTVIKRTTTDVSISAKKGENPYDTRIEDGGKLRPLPRNEQEWIMEALAHYGNTEQTLIHALALCTGARIQTVLTLRKRHILAMQPAGPIRLLCGMGGIDTKGDKRFTIEIPRWLWNRLHTYVLSERAVRRRNRAAGGDVDDQYLFLTEQASPMYRAHNDKFDYRAKRKGKGGKHVKNGQAVRMYMKEYVIKYIRERHDPDFHYQFHDLRATYGMNLVDEYQPKLDAREITYTKVLSIVQARMCHSSPTITERYLKYRENLSMFHQFQDDWELKIENLVGKVMGVAA